jgi:hypothetical protein
LGYRIRDLEVYCEIVGEGKPIVMVHGMGVDHKTMKYVENDPIKAIRKVKE